MKTFETLKEKLQKVAALAEQGKDGEAQAAKLLLQKLLDKHSLTLDDIKQESLTLRTFTFRTQPESSIFSHVVDKVCGFNNNANAKMDRRSGTLYAMLSNAQYVDVSDTFDFHKKLYNEERKNVLKALTSAYINKHNLFAEDHVNPDTQTIDWARLEKSRALQSMLSNKTHTKKIELD